VSQNFRDLAKAMNFSNDDFIRTTEPRHVRACQALWRQLKANGHIYLGSYAGWYAVADEAFYDEADLTPGPGGKKVAPSGAVVEWVEEPSYFFRLSQWQDKLLDYYARTPCPVAPETRRNEVVSFVKSGLKDLSISRTTFKWGIPVPNDPAHVMYVWLDALTNYITAMGFPDIESADWKAFWPADLHMVGKDILRFHTVYWPAFLMAAGLEPPRRVFAHGWWTNEGQKISKRLGNVIDPIELIAKYGLDQVRYFLLREVPFGQDGNYSHDAIVNRTNADLANDLGNLAQRSLSMIAKNCGGRVPQRGTPAQADRAILDQATAALASARKAMPEQAIHQALAAIFGVVAEANRYFAAQEPWALKKTDPTRMETVLYTTAEAIRRIAILCQPFVPGSAAKLLDLLAVPQDQRSFAHFDERNGLVSGTVLPAPEPVFPRYVEQGESA